MNDTRNAWEAHDWSGRLSRQQLAAIQQEVRGHCAGTFSETVNSLGLLIPAAVLASALLAAIA